MKIFELHQKQFLPITMDRAWDFFSNPKNLDEITPEFMKFKITSVPEEKMFNNQIIVYRIKLLPLIYTTWVTEIKSVEEKKFFIDEQRFGPYKMWHHRHIFQETEGGINMIDEIKYSLPFGVIGVIVHKLFVRNRLLKIFSYRKKILSTMFNSG